MEDATNTGQLSVGSAVNYSIDGPVAVIGAGLTGASWAALFASYGRRVKLYDENPQALKDGFNRAKNHARFLADQLSAGPETVENGLRALTSCNEIAESVEGVSFIQEATFENYETKSAVFKAIDLHARREALIATSSSGLSISRIQAAVRFPGRCLAGHPYNPPHLIPLVEIAPGKTTDPAAIEAARRFYVSVGKMPVVLNREVPGYLANRMSAALWREAINLVLSGVASVTDVDRAIQFGPGLRWAVMGPHLLYHLGGGQGGIQYHIDHLRAAKEEMWQDLDDWKILPPDTAEALKQGLPEIEEITQLAQERDVKLARLMEALGIGFDSTARKL